ncbi:cytochrome c biogenesis protein [Mesorhizobium sp. L-8-10]|uniref:cytochrome c-type biogenesis protein n=1 Tax=unclassified Mesorhizobium TaxID=325217 RepID=UPI001926B573|nr:cytochrome c-type biogenesis protein [Mesorhizobium sp. L-8-3]BCH25997.1 cytochrome c biogenesis protein [Mesorhizobium sp. L-8-3]BCH33987.1 cytochrome c biogenesis protein [Mesorhizobium sp. L-8-10]
MTALRAVACWLLLAALLAGPAAYAVQPDEMLKDPALEQRARRLSAELRCMVCQNQSIDDSDADLARDLRILVRDRLSAGDSDRQVLDYIVSRYGEFVLLKPRFSLRNAILWSVPAILLLAGGTFLIVSARTRRRPAGEPLTAEENEALARMLKDGE